MRVAAVALGNTATVVYARAKLLVMEHPPGFEPFPPEDTLEGVIARERLDRQVATARSARRSVWTTEVRREVVGAVIGFAGGFATAAVLLS
jgi:hypothetical protein